MIKAGTALFSGDDPGNKLVLTWNQHGSIMDGFTGVFRKLIRNG